MSTEDPPLSGIAGPGYSAAGSALSNDNTLLNTDQGMTATIQDPVTATDPYADFSLVQPADTGSDGTGTTVDPTTIAGTGAGTYGAVDAGLAGTGVNPTSLAGTVAGAATPATTSNFFTDIFGTLGNFAERAGLALVAIIFIGIALWALVRHTPAYRGAVASIRRTGRSALATA